jgi:hypothetical protein
MSDHADSLTRGNVSKISRQAFIKDLQAFQHDARKARKNFMQFHSLSNYLEKG